MTPKHHSEIWLEPKMGAKPVCFSWKVFKTQNKPKEDPNSNDMMGRVLWTGFVWVRRVNNSHNFDPTRAMTNVKISWWNPPQNLFWSNSHLPKKKRRRLWDQCKELFREHSKEPFGRRKPFAAKNPRRQTCHFAPKPFLWLKAPKLLQKWWRNLPQNLFTPQKRENIGGTSVKPWWNLGKPSTGPFDTETFGSPIRICPRRPETP